MTGNPGPKYVVDGIGCERIQNFALLKEYNSKKQALSVKDIPNLHSTKVLASGGLNAIISDIRFNEFYLWHCAANINEVKIGDPLKKNIDTDS